MISKPFSVRGRTSKGERTPWVRMLSASSFKAVSSKVRRGLVLDSFKRERGTLRYSVALMTWVSMMVCSFRAVEGWKDTERTRAGCVRSNGERTSRGCDLSVKASTNPCNRRLLSQSLAKCSCCSCNSMQVRHSCPRTMIAAPLLDAERNHFANRTGEGALRRQRPSSKHISGSRMASPFCSP